MPSTELQTEDEWNSVGSGLIVCDFWADWAKPCSQMNALFDQLADQYPKMKFVKIEAEKFASLTEKYEVSVVPTFLFIRGGKVVEKIEGANSPELASRVSFYGQIKGESSTDNSKVDLNTRLASLVSKAPVMLFMKGSPEAPQCGFSNKIVAILKQQNIEFSSFNILADEEVRNGLKVYSNWPTYPQLYIEGKLVGGLDIVKEMAEEGELAKLVPTKKDKAQELNDRLKGLINAAPVMLFMKGNPQGPKCGFSAKIVDILNQTGVQFKSFDILTDEEVRNGLKTFSNWPTYPQLYAHGKLIGGLDIVKELNEEGQLLDAVK